MKIKKICIMILCFCLIFCSTILVSSTLKNKKSNVFADARTDLIEAAMQRAEYMYQYRWTPTQTLGGWGTTFYAGNQYTVPYSQPYYYGGYLFYNVTLAQFEEYALNGTNGFYDYHDNNGNTSACPKYGIDCSAFVSFCIGSKTRYTTYTIKTYADGNTNGFYYKSFATAERGDILNCNNSTRQHVLLIKEVNGENITTYESTPGYRVGYQDIRVRTQTKTQWENDGYSVVGHDYVTNCGGAPKDDVTGKSIGLQVKSNTILGACATNNASSKWNTTNAYNPSSADFDNRKVSISSFEGNDTIYFNQSNSTQIKVGATFTTTGKTSYELYGKFGIGFFNSIGKGLFTYVDAFGTNGTSTSSITGTDVGVVARTTEENGLWDWQTSTNYDIATNVYSSSSPITLEIERDGISFKIYVNGNYVKTINGSNYYLSATDKIYPCILTFNTKLEVTNYYSIAKHNSLTIDGNLEDWQNLTSWNSINENKKQVLDTLTDKGATFYTRWTNEGLFIYAIAKHSNNSTGMANWWENTNFEIIINEDDSVSQYYAISNKIRGFDSFYFKTTEENGNYVSILEAFIADCKLFENGINIGFAFKVRNNTNNIHDYITPEGASATDYWWPNNQSVHTMPFTLEKISDTTINPPQSSSNNVLNSSNQNNNENSSSETISSGTGCGANLNTLYLLPLAFIAMVMLIKKYKKY